MKIVSTNIGEAKTFLWNGKEVKSGIFKFSADKPVFLGSEDVAGDHVIDRKHHGGFDKACYLYSSEHYDYWQKLYPEIELPWGMFGENLTVESLYEEEVCIGDVFRIGNAVVQATQPRQPCFKLEFRFGNPNIVRQFIDSGFPGVYLRILQTGFVKAGDKMVLAEKKSSLSVQKVFELLYTEHFQKEAVKKAIEDPFLAEACRKDLLKRWKSKI